MLKTNIKIIPDSRTILLNNLIRYLSYKTYLEIGVGTGVNYRSINCHDKTNVDPDPDKNPLFLMTSDEFFASNRKKFDLIFVDGMHTEEQVTKDIFNSMRFVNQGGTIVVHDCCPEDEEQQIVPRRVNVWTGDVWKSFAKFIRTWTYPSYVVDMDYGCGIIECDNEGEKIEAFDSEFTWQEFLLRKRELLKLTSFEQFCDRVQKRRHDHKSLIKSLNMNGS